MQFLTFQLGRDRYALATADVLAVLPLMALKALPQAPPSVAGLMNLHGLAVPVIDLARLATGIASALRFDTRIMLLRYRLPGGSEQRLGAVAEGVNAIAGFDPAGFGPPGVDSRGAPYLGKVSAADGQLVQLVEVSQLLDAPTRALLFPAAGETPC